MTLEELIVDSRTNYKKGDILKMRKITERLSWYHPDWKLKFVKYKRSTDGLLLWVKVVGKNYYTDYYYTHLEKDMRETRNEKINKILNGVK